MSAGVLVHVYHLDTIGWEDLIWGTPEKDQLGSGPMLVWLLLTEPQDEPIRQIVIGCGPSRRDGLSEAAYTKRFILEHFDQLSEFPRLTKYMEGLGEQGRVALKTRLANIIEMPEIKRTSCEIDNAAKILAGLDKVLQIASASHAPRCLQGQAQARLEGRIPGKQQWFVLPTDVCFNGAKPDETVIIEPPHRGDYPLTYEKPTLADVLKPTLYMPDDDKRALIKSVKAFVDARTE